jgi:biopolymer transport protein ExbB/TolQ
MSEEMQQPAEVQMSFERDDVERRFGFRAGRFTSVNSFLTCLLGGILTAVFYLCMIPLDGSRLAEMFTERGSIPPMIVFLSSWSLAILWIKSRKHLYQKRSLELAIMPDEADFILSSATVDRVLHQMYMVVDDPRRFVLLNRIHVALSNLRNLGRVTDVDEILRSQAENDQSAMDTSFTLIRGFIWAIPVLGFIGTVLGLSAAVGGFGEVLSNTEDLSEITSSLTGVTSGLSIAFETTLEALVAALSIQLLVTFLHKGEEEFLDRCSEYCTTNVVARLRIMEFDQQVE